MEVLNRLLTDLQRNSRFLLAFSRLYQVAPGVTEEIRNEIASIWPDAVHGRALTRVGSRRIERKAVLVSGLGRLGNSVIQVLNCAEIADAIGAKDVYYFRFDALGNRDVPIAGDKNLRRLPYLMKVMKGPPDVIWQTEGFFGLKTLFEPCSKSVQETSASLGAMLGIEGTQESEQSVCTIHMRGGDVFGVKPHPRYGQPPWAYYQMVLESRNWTRVVLVTEDSRNPCVRRLVDWCASNSLPLEIVGRSLPQALQSISRARTLVSSVGTFLPAVLLLSGTRARIFYFGESLPALFCDSNHTFDVIRDVNGKYTEAVMSANWENSSEQRELMMSYNLSNLSAPTKG